MSIALISIVTFIIGMLVFRRPSEPKGLGMDYWREHDRQAAIMECERKNMEEGWRADRADAEYHARCDERTTDMVFDALKNADTCEERSPEEMLELLPAYTEYMVNHRLRRANKPKERWNFFEAHVLDDLTLQQYRFVRYAYPGFRLMLKSPRVSYRVI